MQTGVMLLYNRNCGDVNVSAHITKNIPGQLSATTRYYTNEAQVNQT